MFFEVMFYRFGFLFLRLFTGFNRKAAFGAESRIYILDLHGLAEEA